jgi:Lon protease-like protein
MIELALFPLNTVLYPGGPLPLRIFEPRYLTMVARCLRRSEGFGIVLIKSGSEIGTAETFAVGTVAEIVDWYQASDGLLGITAQGTDRFRLESSTQQTDGLYRGQVALLEAEPCAAVPDRFAPLAEALEGMLGDLKKHYQGVPMHYDKASWVSYRLAEILPLPVSEKQAMLEITDATERLERLRGYIDVTPN